MKSKNQTFWLAALGTALALLIIVNQRDQIRYLSSINTILNTDTHLIRLNSRLTRQIRNLLAMSEDRVIDIGDAKFYVPNYPHDLIQAEITDSGRFYENDLLKTMLPYIPEDAVIWDIGANIGNHSIYWAIRAHAKKVYAFEPVRQTFDLLQKNIQINNLEGKITSFNIGLSDKEINGSIVEYYRENIGGIHVRQDPNGDLVLDKLDNIKFDEDHIDLVKIDVEGHELQVLRGAIETLRKYKPMIWVESFNNKIAEVHSFLTSLGYRRAKTLKDCNYIYTVKPI